MGIAEQGATITEHAASATRVIAPRVGGTMKLTADVVLALMGLIALAPLLIAIGLAIWLDSRGGILFRQQRTGLNNKPFWIYKFRTMHAHQTIDGTVVQATRNDARITAVGRFLRRTSLDELPQLLNVIRGEMSLVGPRPHALEHDFRYSRELPNYVKRFAVRPGLTGLAQIRGARGETVDVADMERRIDLDLYYVDNWTILLDMKIIISTIILELSRKTNAY